MSSDVDTAHFSSYNVTTMKTKIIPIGNSRGIRLSKLALEESGLIGEVEIKVKKGEIKIVPVKESNREKPDSMLLSEKALRTDWNRTEEDEAWATL